MTMRVLRMLALLIAAGGAVASCKAARMAPPADSTGGTGAVTDSALPQVPESSFVSIPRSDSGATEELRRLEREAAALARRTGCEQGSDCRTAPVGNRPCGGPRYYLTYCARTTDSVSLFRKLDELARAEGAYNQREGLASTCEFRMPPEVVASGGSCRAAEP